MTTYTMKEFIAALEGCAISHDLDWAFEGVVIADGLPRVQRGWMTNMLELADGHPIARAVTWEYSVSKGSQVEFDNDEAEWDFFGLSVLGDDGEVLGYADLAELVERHTTIAEPPEGVFVDDDDAGRILGVTRLVAA